MNQQPSWLGQQPQYPQPLQRTPHRYSWYILTSLVAIYIASCVLFAVANGGIGTANPNAVNSIPESIGAILLLALHSVIFLIDGHNFVTLNGKIQWRSLSGWVRVGLAFVYFGGWIMSAIYLVLAIKYCWEVKRPAKVSGTQSTLGQNQGQQAQSYSQIVYPSQSTHTPPVGTRTTESDGKPLAPKSQRIKVFISYSQKDEKYLQRLQTHFAHYERIGKVDVWDDTKLAPGTLRQEEIKKAIAQTRVALLLVSADYLASQFIVENELPPLLRAAQSDGATIIPVIVSACAFEVSELAQFQAVNSPTKPLSSMDWDEREKVWATVAKMVSNTMNPQQPLYGAPKAQSPLVERTKAFEKETGYAQHLILQQPPGWEYLLTAELLHTKLQPIKRRLSDIKSGAVYQRSTPMNGEHFFQWAQARFADLSSLITFATNVLTRDIPVSWGPPGVAGDPLAIKGAVEKVISICDEMLKREIEIHFVVVPSSLAKLRQTMEGWSTEFIYEIDSIPARLAAPFSQSDPRGTLTIHIDFRQPASMKAFTYEMKKVQAKVRRHGKKILFS